MTKRKKYSKEFKLDAIALVIEQNYSQAEASRNLGINPNMLGRWIKEAENDDGHAFRGNGKLTPEQEEIRQLKAQVKRLEMEREVLKKATVDSIGQRNNHMKVLFCGGLLNETYIYSTRERVCFRLMETRKRL